MQTPNLSIVIPHFRSHGKISRLLSSIQNEDEVQSIILIIIDDKSGNEEFELLKKTVGCFPKLNVQIYQNNTDEKGAGAARNIGISKVKTEWLMFADADDSYLPNFYKKLFPYFKSDNDIIFFPPISSDEDGNKLERHKSYLRLFEEYWESDSEEGLRYRLGTVWSRLYRTAFIKENGIDFENIISSNDVMFALKSGIYSKKIIVDTNEIYCWVLNRNSITTVRSKKSFQDIVDLAVRKDLLMKSTLDESIYKRNRPTMMYYLTTSLVRYKYGMLFSYKIFIKLFKNNISFFRAQDISLPKLINFLKNNKYYLKTH